MTTALRQRIVIAQSLTSLSWLALKSSAFILYLVFKRRHEMNLHFCSFSYSWILLFHPMCKNKRSVPFPILSGGTPPPSPQQPIRILKLLLWGALALNCRILKTLWGLQRLETLGRWQLFHPFTVSCQTPSAFPSSPSLLLFIDDWQFQFYHFSFR